MSLENNLKRFLDNEGVYFEDKGQSFITDCINPSCKKEMHMYIRKTDGYTTCFKCHHKWKWRDLISGYTGCDIGQAYSKLNGYAVKDLKKFELSFSRNEIDEDDIKIDNNEYIELSSDFIPVEDSLDGLRYIMSRGITDPDIISAFDIRWHEVMKAVVFPIYFDGYIWGWQARKINPGPDEPRLLTKTGMNKSEFLLNYDLANKMSEIVLVEGPFDCLKVYQAGYGAVASFGMMVSNKQIEMLINSDVKKIYNGLDPDAGAESMSVTRRLLFSKKEIYRVTPPEGKKDFGDCNSEEIVLSMNNAVRVESTAAFLEFNLKK